ncbi:hypothetical protein M408DRAFT_202977 [Serendipita vermifera MAFF 305830]|uniref:WSC domain-containing protein n=1 Tax=Serendipita vermifera MAFF 305830 TaxID=933852 RepID=A0A0C3B189_SERVB|nr:hypothetical protein M408DRAFT_202977 [Serendipita vermifera MAFF 305830]
MLISTLASLVPFLLATNALPLESRDGPTDNALVARDPGSNWVKIGCYVDTVSPRTLTGAQTVSDTAMTNGYCQQFCASRGFSIAGTEYSKECYCDNTIANPVLADEATCDMTCTGGVETCGGSARLTVWSNQGTPPAPGHETYGDWTGQGCYYDSVASRALPTQISIDQVTIEKCTAACFNGGFQYAGVEYGSECFCGDVIATDSGNVGTSAPDGCTMPCAGNTLEICGGSNRLNILSYTGSSLPSGPSQVPSVGDWDLKGCYSDDVTNRALPVRQTIEGGLTVEKCTDKCFSLGYKFSGVEYGSECYCSNAIGTYPNSGSPQTDGCAMPCEGAPSTEICGGSNRLSLYEYTGSGLSITPTELPSYNDFNSKGCYVDSVNARVLTPLNTAQAPMTVGNCVDACSAAGFTVAGLEFSSECYCGNALPPLSTTEGCVMACAGDSAHLCGGPDRLNVYQKEEAPVIRHYRIRTVRASTGDFLGYVAQNLGAFILPTYTTDVAAAAVYEIDGDATSTIPFSLHQLNPPDANHQYFGPYEGTPNYNIIGTISKTNPGDTKQPTGSTRSQYSLGESAVFSLNAVTSQLTQIWVQDNGVAVPTIPYYYGSGTIGYFMAVINEAAFQSIFTIAVKVNWYLEEVTA